MGEPAVSPVLRLAHNQSGLAGEEGGGREGWLDGLETETVGFDRRWGWSGFGCGLPHVCCE